MRRHLIAAALAMAMPPVAALSQTQVQTPAPTDAPAKPAAPAAAPKVYLPGLEQFMNVILMEHNRLWFAAKARHWELAAYELGEIKEVMGDVQSVIPVFKGLPFADMLDAVIVKEIVDLENAIEAKDFKKFAAGYDRLNAACNACHEATGVGFIVIQRPSRPAFTNQVYKRRR